MPHIRVLHGPNLNLLGQREPRHYGAQSLSSIDDQLISNGHKLGHRVDCLQYNAEHQLIETVHASVAERIAFIIINPAAFSHTSIALRDALHAVAIPFIEVHLSNIYAREPFRQHSYCAGIAVGSVVGLGAQGYLLALQAAHDYLIRQHMGETKPDGFS